MRALIAVVALTGCATTHETDPFVVEVDGEARSFYTARTTSFRYEGRLRVDAQWAFPGCGSESVVPTTFLLEVDPATLVDGTEARYEVRGRARWDTYDWMSASWEPAVGGSPSIRRLVLGEQYMFSSPYGSTQTFSGVVRLVPTADRVHAEIDLSADDIAGRSGTEPTPAVVRGAFDAPRILFDRPRSCD